MRLDGVIREIITSPYSGKRLRGDLSGKWSLRMGDYRIIYIIDEDNESITLLRIRHRKIVYK